METKRGEERASRGRGNKGGDGGGGKGQKEVEEEKKKGETTNNPQEMQHHRCRVPLYLSILYLFLFYSFSHHSPSVAPRCPCLRALHQVGLQVHRTNPSPPSSSVPPSLLGGRINPLMQIYSDRPAW